MVSSYMCIIVVFSLLWHVFSLCYAICLLFYIGFLPSAIRVCCSRLILFLLIIATARLLYIVIHALPV